MKKLLAVLVVCFAVTGCGAGKTAVVETKAYEQEDVTETTTAKETTTESADEEMEYAFTTEELIERISKSYPKLQAELINDACNIDPVVSILYYYNALKTNMSDGDLGTMLMSVAVGEGFKYDDLVTTDIHDIAYDMSILDVAETSYAEYKSKFINDMAERIYDTYGYRFGYTDEIKNAVQFLCENDLEATIAYYYEYLIYGYNDYTEQDKISLAITNAEEGKIIDREPDLSFTDIVKKDVTVLDDLEANYRSYVDEVNASVVAAKESRAAEEASLAAKVESEGLFIAWEPVRYDADGMDFQGAGVSSAWYGVEFQKGTGNDGSIYYRGLFNNKNDEGKHLYAEWTYKNGGESYMVEVPYSQIIDCEEYYRY